MNKTLQDKLSKMMEEAWDKMGDCNSDNVIHEESFWCGAYRALEDIEDFLNQPVEETTNE